jgi:hypothetical protein
MIEVDMTMLWIVGLICIAIGVGAIYAARKGWIK